MAMGLGWLVLLWHHGAAHFFSFILLWSLKNLESSTTQRGYFKEMDFKGTMVWVGQLLVNYIRKSCRLNFLFSLFVCRSHCRITFLHIRIQGSMFYSLLSKTSQAFSCVEHLSGLGTIFSLLKVALIESVYPHKLS